MWLQVPQSATWAELAVTAGSHTSPKLFMVHATQLLPHTRPNQFRQALSLSSEADTRAHFSVTGGVCLEVHFVEPFHYPCCQIRSAHVNETCV